MKQIINLALIFFLGGSITIITGYAVSMFVNGLTDFGWILAACDVVAICEFIQFWRR